MDFTIFRNEQDMARQTADEIAQDLRRNPRQLLCVAAGFTSVGLFRELADRCRRGELDFSRASFVAMDEWLDMDADTEGSCGWLLRTELITKVNYQEGNVFLFNGKNRDYASECARAVQFIQDHAIGHAIDFLVLGTGMNGHLALNEPGTALTQRAHAAELDASTARVGQKYFQAPVTLRGGLTLGLADFQEAARTILLISGSRKSGVLQKLKAAGRFQPDVPATAVYAFHHAAVYCDQDAARGG